MSTIRAYSMRVSCVLGLIGCAARPAANHPNRAAQGAAGRPAVHVPLCPRVMENARKRYQAAAATYGEAWVAALLENFQAREELEFCEEDEHGAWSFGIVGVEPGAEACNPDASDACSDAAEGALRGTIRYTEPSRELTLCWNRSTSKPVSCSAQLAAYNLYAGQFWNEPSQNRAARIEDIDHDGRSELIFRHRDSNVIDPHDWYVVIRLNAAGRALEEHPDSVSSNIVGFEDVNGDGVMDLLTRASAQRCSDDVDDDGNAICEGEDAPLRCRLGNGYLFGPETKCPRRGGSSSTDPDFGWAPLATGR